MYLVYIVLSGAPDGREWGYDFGMVLHVATLQTSHLIYHWSQFVATVFIRGHNTCFHREMGNVIPGLSSVLPFIWSSGLERSVIMAQSDKSKVMCLAIETP